MLFPSSGGTGKCQILSSAGNTLGNKIIGKIISVDMKMQLG